MAVRDFLLIDLFTVNAQRTCVGETISIEEYAEREYIDGKIRIKVS